VIDNDGFALLDGPHPPIWNGVYSCSIQHRLGIFNGR
jgi:hypothetical protein